MASIAQHSRKQGAGFLLYTSTDLHRELGARDRRQAGNIIRSNPGLRAVYDSGSVTLFRIE